MKDFGDNDSSDSITKLAQIPDPSSEVLQDGSSSLSQSLQSSRSDAPMQDLLSVHNLPSDDPADGKIFPEGEPILTLFGLTISTI